MRLAIPHRFFLDESLRSLKFFSRKNPSAEVEVEEKGRRSLKPPRKTATSLQRSTKTESRRSQMKVINSNRYRRIIRTLFHLVVYQNHQSSVKYRKSNPTPTFRIMGPFLLGYNIQSLLLNSMCRTSASSSNIRSTQNMRDRHNWNPKSALAFLFQ